MAYSQRPPMQLHEPVQPQPEQVVRDLPPVDLHVALRPPLLLAHAHTAGGQRVIDAYVRLLSATGGFFIGTSSLAIAIEDGEGLLKIAAHLGLPIEISGEPLAFPEWLLAYTERFRKPDGSTLRDLIATFDRTARVTLICEARKDDLDEC